MLIGTEGCPRRMRWFPKRRRGYESWRSQAGHLHRSALCGGWSGEAIKKGMVSNRSLGAPIWGWRAYRYPNNHQTTVLGKHKVCVGHYKQLDTCRMVGRVRGPGCTERVVCQGHSRQTMENVHFSPTWGFFALAALAAGDTEPHPTSTLSLLQQDKASIKALTMLHLNDLFTSLHLLQD